VARLHHVTIAYRNYVWVTDNTIHLILQPKQAKYVRCTRDSAICSQSLHIDRRAQFATYANIYKTRRGLVRGHRSTCHDSVSLLQLNAPLEFRYTTCSLIQKHEPAVSTLQSQTFWRHLTCFMCVLLLACLLLTYKTCS
jgi:hypothetical protein